MTSLSLGKIGPSSKTLVLPQTRQEMEKGTLDTCSPSTATSQVQQELLSMGLDAA